MDVKLVGGQIAKFRKAAGLTQEELGRAVGVSTQAVSRWECGGTPDVALLPAIADRLHITIDAIFGREGGAPVDMEEMVRLWIDSLPREQRLERLSRLLWDASKQIVRDEIPLPENGMEYMNQCEVLDREGEQMLVRTVLGLEQGLVLGVCAEDMSFMSVYPEPEAGYAAYLSPNDTYRGLFSVLAQPGSLEILRYLYGENERFYVAEAVAKCLDIPVERAETLMSGLEEVHLLTKMELELSSGTVNAYKVHDTGAIVPFLYLSRCLIQEKDSFYLCWEDRKRPWLRQAHGQTEA